MLSVVEEHRDDAFELAVSNIYKCPVIGCHWYTGDKREDGYGVVLVNNTYHGLASRVIWNHYNPTRKMGINSYPFLTCGNMKCCNPEHMIHSKPKTYSRSY